MLYVFLSLTILHVATGAADFSWVRGVNYVPSTAHNDVATFQDYNKTLVELELGFARRSGFNAVRTFLSTLPYFYNPTAFLSNLAHFVQTLEALNLTSQLVVFDSCFGDTTANETWITSGQYKNATWIPNPGPAKIADNSTWPPLVQYVTDVARTVGTSKAVLLWDIHNEPNFALPNILPFISFMTQTLLSVDPGARPITSGIASASQQPLVQSIVTALSFHSYDGGGGGKDLRVTIEEQQALAASLGKGVLLTEAMSRPSDLLGAVLPAVTGCLTTPPTPPMGFFLWELMLGVDQFNYNWDMPFQGLVNPDASATPPWRRTPGTWWSNEEQELFQAYFPPAAASYTLQSSRCPSPSNATSFLPDTCPCMDYSPAEDWTAWSGVGPQPQGTLHYSNTLSTAEVTLPLGTTQVWLVYKSGPDCGLFDVYLDGTLVAPQLDSFAPSVDWDTRVLLGKDLSGTMEHSALVVASGKGNPLSSNTYTQIVGFEVNLKGSIYLLTLENEMLKKAVQTGGAGPKSAAAMMAGSTTFGNSALNPVHTSASLLSNQLPSPEYPSEIGDAFEMMRQKYTQLEHKYQHDLEEARRGAEALASHCAAQSSLIATLKREVAQGTDVLKDQKVIVQRVEAKSAADLELAQKDIGHLHARIVELSEEKRALRAQIEATNVTVADLKGAAGTAVAESASAEEARRVSLDSYARQLIASRFLLIKWRAELNQRKATELSYDKMRGEKAAAERRALRAETEAGKERSSAAAAAATHSQQTEAWGEERERLVATIDGLSASLGATQAELATCKHNLRVLDSQLPDLAARLERGAGALVRMEGQLALTQKRGGELERLLVAKGEEAEVLRNAAVLAEGRQRALLTTLRATEKELADANSRATALSSAEREQEKSRAGLVSEAEALGQANAAAAAEIATLKDELSRRPPIDVIKELDVENLLQRNMQAAAAMHSLLAWQTQHAANPVGATLKAPALPPQPPSKY